jgi:hypothetical protein
MYLIPEDGQRVACVDGINEMLGGGQYVFINF